MTRPRLLDLFCCEGGAGVGYARAGFTVTGVDIKPKRRYPFLPVKLCGCMFDLSTIDDDGERIYLQRARLFETNFPLTAPRECDHSEHKWVGGAYGGARRDKHEAKYVRKGGYVPPNKDVVQRLLGIEHDMTWNGLFESIPPAYTEYVGHRLIEHLQEMAA